MKILHKIIILSAIILPALVSFNCEEQFEEDTSVNWLENTYATFNDEQKIGQLLCLRIDPIEYFLYPQYKRNINTLIRKYNPGGVYFSSKLEDYSSEVLNEFNGDKLLGEVIEMNRISNIPLLVAADFETGAWYWDKTATIFPFALALGTANSPELSYRQGKITAVEAKTQGINLIFAPVMNTTINPQNVSFNIRTFAEDTEIASQIGSSFIRGCQDIGVAASMKFFPDKAWMQYDKIDPSRFAPFKAGIDVDVMSVRGPDIDVNPDNQGNTLLFLNEAFNQLRNVLGYDGLVMCEVTGLAHLENVRQGNEILIASLTTGNNMFLLPEITDENIPVIDFMHNYVRENKSEMMSVESSVRKILTLKENMKVYSFSYDRPLDGMAGLGLKEYYQASMDISSAAVTLLKNEHNVIPLDYENQYIASITFLDEYSTYASMIYKEKLLEISENIKFLSVLGVPDKIFQREILRRAQEADVVVCSFLIRPSEDTGVSKPSEEILEIMKNIIKINDTVAVISYFNPYLIQHIPGAGAFMISYSSSETSMDAAIDVLFGERNPQGKLPITISEKYPIGFGINVGGELLE